MYALYIQIADNSSIVTSLLLTCSWVNIGGLKCVAKDRKVQCLSRAEEECINSYDDGISDETTAIMGHPHAVSEFR